MKCKFHNVENCKVCSYGKPRNELVTVEYGHSYKTTNGLVTIMNLENMNKVFEQDNVYYTNILNVDNTCGHDAITAKEFYNNIVNTIDDSAVVNGARCKCKKEPYIGKYQIGAICSACGTEIVRDIEEQSAYIEADGDNRFMNPSVIYAISKTQIGKAFLNIVKRGGGKWSADKSRAYNGGRPYAFTKKLISIFGSMPSYRILQTYFPTIVMIGISVLKNSVKDKEDREVLTMILNKYKEDQGYIFTKYVKLPPSLFMTQRIKVSNTMFRTVAVVAEIISRYTATVTLPANTPNLKNLITKMHSWISFKIYSSMMVTNKEVLKKKKGFFRGDLDSGRRRWSHYNVLTQPIGYKPSVNNVYIPWKTALMNLREPVMYYLTKTKGMDGLEAYRLIESNYHTYNKILDEAFDACEDFGFTCRINRPPQLHVGSFFQLDIKIKRDPKIKTQSIHPLLFKTLNADTDGDNLLSELDISATLSDQNAIWRPANLTFAGPPHSVFLTTILKTTAFNLTNFMLREHGTNKQFNWVNRKPPAFIEGTSKEHVYDKFKQGASHATNKMERKRQFYPDRTLELDEDEIYPTKFIYKHNQKTDTRLNDLAREFKQVSLNYAMLKEYVNTNGLVEIAFVDYLKGNYDTSLLKKVFGKKCKIHDHIINQVFQRDGFFESNLYQDLNYYLKEK